MLSINRIKYIRSLHQKKYRQKYSQFLVEGLKTVEEFINQQWEVEQILVQEGFEVSNRLDSEVSIIRGSKQQMTQVSSFKAAPPVMAIVKMRKPIDFDISQSCIALDDINDPGNLGTIIRIADWYGISQVIVSKSTVDEYNAKVLAATMGSLARVKIIRNELQNTLGLFQGKILAAVLEGTAIHEITQLSKPFCLLIGSESHGISTTLLSQLDCKRVTIPRVGPAESLNAGVATGILVDRLING